jgi:diadenosine tetraphosphatase ApaH/serine/threonine PP2A family protein phosphatase
MHYAVFSDVHANLEALETIVADAARHHPDAYVCLGDVVGYGPDPNECVAQVQALGGDVIAGNHDRAAIGGADLDLFSPLARTAIEWTMRVLSDETRRFLASLPLRLETPTFLAVHGSPRDPVDEYILDLPTALAVFNDSHFTLCFVGHSHVPGAFVLRGDGKVGARALPPGEAVRLTRGSRYIVNVGSVGQPRDGDSRACYLLLDTAARSVTLRRLRYPLTATQEKMVARGLPALLARRLSAGL